MGTALFPTLYIFAVTEPGLIKSVLVMTYGVCRTQEMSARAHFAISVFGKSLIRDIKALVEPLLLCPKPICIHHEFFKAGAQPSFQPTCGVQYKMRAGQHRRMH